MLIKPQNIFELSYILANYVTKVSSAQSSASRKSIDKPVAEKEWKQYSAISIEAKTICLSVANCCQWQNSPGVLWFVYMKAWKFIFSTATPVVNSWDN